MSLRDLTQRPAADPALTLILLHHAGGSAGCFLPFVPHLPADWRLLAVDLPGRLFEPTAEACGSSDEAVEHLLAAVLPELTDGPHAVFGHSMGALLGFELVRALEDRGRGPRWLGVSGCPAPETVGTAQAGSRSRSRSRARARDRGAGRSIRPADRLADRLADEFTDGFAGPLAGLVDERIHARVVRTLQADLAIVDGYEYVPGPPVRAALSVFRGGADPLAPIGLTNLWAGHTDGPVAFHTWPGRHFYLFDRPAAVCARLVRTCRSLLARDAA